MDDDPSMRITAYREAVRALEDAQQFILSWGHVKEAMDIGLSVGSIDYLHLSTHKQTTLHQFYTPWHAVDISVYAISFLKWDRSFKVLGGGTSE